MKPSAARIALVGAVMFSFPSCAGQRSEARRILRGDVPHPHTASTPAIKNSHHEPPPAPRPPTSVIEREAEDEETAKALFERLITQP